MKPPAALESDSAAPVLEVRDLTILRDRARVLSGVNWRVRPGEHWVMLGPNGSGKTSLLATLNAHLAFTHGELWVFGRKYGECDWRELRRSIGTVSASIHRLIDPESDALTLVAGGREGLFNYWQAMPRADARRARELLAEVECPAVARRPWAVLSQGERQRVLIARALMAGPRLLILDEPCAGLDPVARETFLEFLGRLARRPGAPTLVLVTHHVEEITPVFTHALLLRAGAVVAAGPMARTLTSANLSAAFGGAVRLGRSGGRFALKPAPHPGKAA